VGPGRVRGPMAGGRTRVWGPKVQTRRPERRPGSGNVEHGNTESKDWGSKRYRNQKKKEERRGKNSWGKMRDFTNRRFPRPVRVLFAVVEQRDKRRGALQRCPPKRGGDTGTNIIARKWPERRIREGITVRAKKRLDQDRASLKKKGLRISEKKKKKIRSPRLVIIRRMMGEGMNPSNYAQGGQPTRKGGRGKTQSHKTGFWWGVG